MFLTYPFKTLVKEGRRSRKSIKNEQERPGPTALCLLYIRLRDQLIFNDCSLERAS